MSFVDKDRIAIWGWVSTQISLAGLFLNCSNYLLCCRVRGAGVLSVRHLWGHGTGQQLNRWSTSCMCLYALSLCKPSGAFETEMRITRGIKNNLKGYCQVPVYKMNQYFGKKYLSIYSLVPLYISWMTLIFKKRCEIMWTRCMAWLSCFY